MPGTFPEGFGLGVWVPGEPLGVFSSPKFNDGSATIWASQHLPFKESMVNVFFAEKVKQKIDGEKRFCVFSPMLGLG